MYLKKQHFISLFEQATDQKFSGAFHTERLSSKAFLISTGSTLYIFYVNTLVFKMENKKITLDNGGWKTNTTKKWINYGFAILHSKDYLFQKDYQWYISTPNETIDFDDYNNE